MSISEMYKNRALRSTFRFLSIVMIVTTVLLSVRIDAILAQQKENADQVKIVREQMDAAYSNYVQLLSSGKENSAEGNAAFSAYASLKAQYDSMTGASGQQSLSSAQKSAVPTMEQVGETAKKAGESLWQRLVRELRERVLPGGSKKQMSLVEQVAWGVARSIIPTAAVLVLASLVAMPLSMLVVGSIAIGAVTSAALTYFYERRMNTFREKKKTNMEILRDVTVSAVADGIMAPFTMATAGLASTFGKAGAKVIIANAARGAALQLGGQTISSGAAGLVKRAWAKNYFHYDEQIQTLQKEADSLIANHSKPGDPPITQVEKDRLATISNMIADMKAQDYTMEDFQKDFKRAALSSVISGVIGTSAAGIAASSKPASLASLKLFGDTSHAGAIANWVTSNPVAFIQGSSRAVLEKHFITQDIGEAVAVRDRYQKGTAAYQYYDQQVQRLQTQHESINPLKKGLEATVVNFAVQSVSLGVSLGKEKLIDAPRRDRAAINERYKEQSAEWKKASDFREKVTEFSEKNQPRPENYTDINKYIKDKLAYNRQLAKLEKEACRLEVTAAESQNLSANKEAFEKVTQEYYRDKQLDRNLEYARIMGQENYLKAFKVKLRSQDEKYASMADDELTAFAKTEIASQNKIALERAQKDLDALNAKLDSYRAIKNPNGRNVNPPEAIKEVLEGKRELTSAEARAIEFQAAKISPSAYKAKLVNYEIAKMRVNGASDSQILSASDTIYARAEDQMLKKYGGWSSVMYYEMSAKQLSNLKYSDDGTSSLKGTLFKLIGKEVPQKVEAGFVDHYRTEVNSAIRDQLMPGEVVQGGEEDLGALLINTSASALFDKVVIAGSTAATNSAYQNFKNNVFGKPAGVIERNAVTPQEIMIINQNRQSSGRISE